MRAWLIALLLMWASTVSAQTCPPNPAITVERFSNALKTGESGTASVLLTVPAGHKVVSVTARLVPATGPATEQLTSIDATNGNAIAGIRYLSLSPGKFGLYLRVLDDKGCSDTTALKREVVVTGKDLTPPPVVVEPPPIVTPPIPPVVTPPITQIGPYTPLTTCHSTTASPTGVNPKIGWTPCRQDVWNREYACYLLNPTDPPAGLHGALDCGDGSGGKWMKLMKANADCSCRYADLGQYDVFMYQVTGSTAYAQSALPKIQTYRTYIDSTSGGNYENEIRESGIRLVRWYEWLKPGLTAAQDADYKVWLGNFVNPGNHQPYGCYDCWRVGDSDQTTGQYFAATIFYLLDPSNSDALRNFTHPLMGGLTPTMVPNSTYWRSDLSVAAGGTARNAIQNYLQVLAKGGTWPESSDYNNGTNMILLEGYDAVGTLTGLDYYPEITGWLNSNADAMIMSQTPDMRQGFGWGDDQDPHGFWVHMPYQLHWIGHAMMLQGLLQGTPKGRQLHQYMHDLWAIYGTVGGLEPAAGTFTPLTMYNPYDGVEDWKSIGPFYAAPGPGIYVSKSGSAGAATDSMLMIGLTGGAIHNTPEPDGLRNFVDHIYYTMGDWQLYRNGHWAVTHPLGYGGPTFYRDGHNGPLMYGHGAMSQYRAGSVLQTTAFTYATVTTGGALMDPIYQRQQGGPVDEWTRELIYLPTPSVGGIDTVLIHDRANVVHPLRDQGSYFASSQPDTLQNGPYGYLGDLLAYEDKSPTIFQLHTFTKASFTGNVASWTTDGGETGRLTVLAPAAFSSEVTDETALAHSGTQLGAIWNGPLVPGELKFNFKVWPTNFSQFGTFLNVFQVGGQAETLEKLGDPGKAEAAHLSRAGEPDVLAVFNTEASPLITPLQTYSSGQNAQIADTRYRRAGYGPITWTAVGSATLLILSDLNPDILWTVKVDGAAATALAPDAHGVYSATVPGAGRHTIEVGVR